MSACCTDKEKTDMKIAIEDYEQLSTKTYAEGNSQPTYLLNPHNRSIKIRKKSNYILQVI